MAAIQNKQSKEGRKGICMAVTFCFACKNYGNESKALLCVCVCVSVSLSLYVFRCQVPSLHFRLWYKHPFLDCFGGSVVKERLT